MMMDLKMRPIYHGDAAPLVFQGSLFASAGPRLVSWGERRCLQAPGVEPGPAAAGVGQRK